MGHLIGEDQMMLGPLSLLGRGGPFSPVLMPVEDVFRHVWIECGRLLTLGPNEGSFKTDQPSPPSRRILDLDVEDVGDSYLLTLEVPGYSK